jgi:hypothetical protein
MSHFYLVAHSPVNIQDSSVGIAMGHGGHGSVLGRGKIASPLTSRPALGPTQPPIQLVQGVLSVGVNSKGMKLTIHLLQTLRVRIVELYFHSLTHLHGMMLD